MFDSTLDRGIDFVDDDPEPSADYLLELTEEAAAEWAGTGEESPGLPPGLDSWLPPAYLAAVVSALSSTTSHHSAPGDHTIRHHGWTYVTNPDNTITWTSPLGHKYTKRPWRPPWIPGGPPPQPSRCPSSSRRHCSVAATWLKV